MWQCDYWLDPRSLCLLIISFEPSLNLLAEFDLVTLPTLLSIVLEVKPFHNLPVLKSIVTWQRNACFSVFDTLFTLFTFSTLIRASFYMEQC